VGKAVVEVDFDVRCPGSPVRVTRDGERVDLVLWHTERLIELSTVEKDLPGALLLTGQPRGKLADELLPYFGGKPFVEVEVDVSRRGVVVEGAGWQIRLSRVSR
jgi:hypothetical protein